MAQKILIYTKARTAAKNLCDGLEKRGFTVQVTGNKRKMLSLAAAGRCDFFVFDGGDQESDQDFCRRLRQLYEYAHIIVVSSARKGKANFAEVADAVIAPPLTLRKVVRRIHLFNEMPPPYLLHVADVTLDPKERVLSRDDGYQVRLTPKETRLLKLLMCHANQIVSKEEIMREVWDTAYTGDMRTIHVHIRWLRQKLEPVPSHPVYIHTVRGTGYWFGLNQESHPLYSCSESAP